MKSIFNLFSIVGTSALVVLSSCAKKEAATPIKIPVITVSTLAGSGKARLLDGTDAAAEFHQASDLAISASGDLYVGDWLNNVVRKINLSTSAVTTFAGSGTPGFNNSTLTSSTFNGVAHAAFDKAGNMFIADEQNNSIREISAAGIVSTVAGRGTAGYVSGPPNLAAFNTPGNLVADANGNLYVADTGNEVMRKINIST